MQLAEAVSATKKIGGTRFEPSSSGSGLRPGRSHHFLGKQGPFFPRTDEGTRFLPENVNIVWGAELAVCNQTNLTG